MVGNLVVRACALARGVRLCERRGRIALLVRRSENQKAFAQLARPPLRANKRAARPPLARPRHRRNLVGECASPARFLKDSGPFAAARRRNALLQARCNGPQPAACSSLMVGARSIARLRASPFFTRQHYEWVMTDINEMRRSQLRRREGGQSFPPAWQTRARSKTVLH